MNKFWLKDIVHQALQEDLGSGDITSESLVPVELTATAEFIAKTDGVLAGLPVAEFVFLTIDSSLRLHMHKQDGERIHKGEILASVTGSARSILSGERVSLNFMQRLSGIATLTQQYVTAVQAFPVRIVDTRKTTPGLRMLEKYAVRQGGGSNHRLGLFDAVLIKDNHIAALKGDIVSAVQKARQTIPHTMKIEVEVTNESQVHAALTACADIIMLDNMSIPEMQKMVTLINHQAVIEASGNVSMETVVKIAETGVDIISIGALTHSAPALDISLNFNPLL